MNQYSGRAVCTSGKDLREKWVLIEGKPEREVANTVGNHIHVWISQHLLNRLEAGGSRAQSAIATEMTH